MTTRLYLPHTAETPAFSPTPDAGWEDTSILVRAIARTTKISDTLAQIDFPDDSDTTDKDILFRQYVSFPLTAGQTITGSQAIKGQCRVFEAGLNGNLFFTVGIRVLAADGSTIQKTVLAVTRDDVEAVLTATNRQFTATSAATNYTTVSGDRLIIEIGMGGDPGSGGSHASSMFLGDSDASDLPEDDTTTSNNNPWVQLNDSLTFIVPTVPRIWQVAPVGSSPVVAGNIWEVGLTQ